MANGGYLVPPEEDPGKKVLWDETWKRLNRFLPEMYREIYPEPREAPSAKGADAEVARAERGDRLEGERLGSQDEKGKTEDRTAS